MKATCAVLIVMLLGITIIATPTHLPIANEETDVARVLQEIHNLVTKMRETFIDKSSEEVRVLNVASGSVSTLIQIGKGKTASRNYVYSLELDRSLLKTYESRKDIQLLKVSSSDLNIKASYAEDNPNEPFKEIRVKAHTKNKDGQTQNGYRVWSALTGELASGFTRFTCQSSPAIRLLTPGEHFIYATRGEITTKPERYPIGDNTKPGTDGYREEDIDVDVP